MKRLFILILFIVTNVAYSQIMDWTGLSQTVNNNINSLIQYNSKLIVGGSFTIAGGLPANKIASYDGTSWSALGSGIKGAWSGSNVYELATFNNELYAAGQFDSAGSVGCKNIAKWNGISWSGFGSGANSGIYAIAFYNGQLYAGGTFNNISGVPVKQIAKWNGITWQSVGAGITYGYSISDLCVYQNELYALGTFDSIGNLACRNIARWNGTNWNNVSFGVPYPYGDLHVWQNKLLIGAGTSTNSSNSTQIWQWNGSTLTLLSENNDAGGCAFLNSNNQLYSSGIISGSANKSNVSVWNSTNSLWDTVGTKIKQVNALCEFNNEIYCAGDFKIATGAQSDYIAKLANTTGINGQSLNNENIKIYPNPVNDKLILDFDKVTNYEIKLTIINSLGQIIFSLNNSSQKQKIDLSFLATGIYYLKVQSYSEQKLFKIIKE